MEKMQTIANLEFGGFGWIKGANAINLCAGSGKKSTLACMQYIANACDKMGIQKPESEFNFGGTDHCDVRNYHNTLHRVCAALQDREELIRVIKWLLADRKMDMYTQTKGPNPQMAVHMLGNNTCIEVVQIFLDHGFELEKGLDGRRSSILHQACSVSAMESEEERLSLVKFLIGKGMDPHKLNDDKWSPILFAVQGGNSKIAKYLIEECAVKVNATADHNQEIGTMLHVIANRPGKTAYRMGDAALVELLMQKVDGTPDQLWTSLDANGKTFMHILAKKLCFKHFEIALKSGYLHMSNNIEDDTGKTWRQIFESQPYAARNRIQCLLEARFWPLCGERIEANDHKLL